MSRINCHSAFKHYEMFHSRGGDVINIGSNNTTIFNMGAGFGGGSFWSGLGYGLGNGLGSIFGGLFGGNMGGFGNFGFGMSPWAGMGMFYNSMGAGGYGGSNRVDSHSDGKGKVKDDSISNKNIDYAKLNKLFERKNNLLEAKNPKLTDLEKLKKDIDKLAKDLDGNDDGNDNDYIKQLKRGLDDKINELKAKEPANKTAAPETKVDGADNKGKVAPADGTGNVKDDAAVGSTKFDDKLKEAGNDRNKLLALINDSSLTPEQRAKAKAKFYYPGYSNVTADDLKDETKAKALLETLKTVVDTSDKYDFTNLKNVTATKSEGKWVITADSTFAKGSLAKLKYTFKETVDGELIFVGTKETQHYVLQKNDQGVHLMQYDYHLGHGSYDVKVAG